MLQLSLAGIRQRFPEATDSECRIRLARLTLGPELACFALIIRWSLISFAVLRRFATPDRVQVGPSVEVVALTDLIDGSAPQR